jgi:hypothetical protein
VDTFHRKPAVGLYSRSSCPEDSHGEARRRPCRLQVFIKFGAGTLTKAEADNTLDSGITLPGYMILNACIHYSYKNFEIAANFNHITNEVYRSGVYNSIYKWPGPPGNFMVNVGCEF